MGAVSSYFNVYNPSPDHIIALYDSMTKELETLLYKNRPENCSKAFLLRMDQHQSSGDLCWHYRYMSDDSEENERVLLPEQWNELLIRLKNERPLLDYEIVHNQLDGLQDLCIVSPQAKSFKNRASRYVNESIRIRLCLLNASIVTIFLLLLYLGIRSDYEAHDTYMQTMQPETSSMAHTHEEL